MADADVRPAPLFDTHDFIVSECLDLLPDLPDLTEEALIATIEHEKRHHTYFGGRQDLIDALEEKLGELRRIALANAAARDLDDLTSPAAPVDLAAPLVPGVVLVTSADDVAFTGIGSGNENPPESAPEALAEQAAAAVDPACPYAPGTYGYQQWQATREAERREAEIRSRQ